MSNIPKTAKFQRFSTKIEGMKDIENALISSLPPLCTPQRLADATGIPVGTWAAWRSLKTGPAYTKAGSRVLYPRDAIIRWLVERTVEPVA